jgi:hypothetical protein
VIHELRRLHEEFVLVPTDKAYNNIVFVCNTHYYNRILNELGIISAFGNPSYTPTAHSKDEILQNHRSVLDTFNIPVNGMDRYELPYLYWIPKLHKKPYKHRYIAGSSKCSIKPLSLLLTNILTALNVMYHNICQKWRKSDVDSQKFKRSFSKSKSIEPLSNTV